MKRLLAFLTISLLLTGCAHKAAAPQQPSAEEIAAAQSRAMMALSPDEMMAKIKEAGTPGEEHQKIASLAGTFKTVTKIWMDPSKDPEVTKGTAKNQWILGKRFLKQDYSGKFMGQPFQGTGVVGYDKVKKEYVSTWVDTMGTGMMTGEGQFNSEKNELVSTSHYSCPLVGGDKTSRMVTRIINKNEYVLEMFDTGPDGKEMKTMEITHRRVS